MSHAQANTEQDGVYWGLLFRANRPNSHTGHKTRPSAPVIQAYTVQNKALCSSYTGLYSTKTLIQLYSSGVYQAKLIRLGHRRRINTKENAKVVAAVWGTEFIQFLAASFFVLG